MPAGTGESSSTAATTGRAQTVTRSVLRQTVLLRNTLIIGASLSKPHTSLTSLHTCVSMLACLLGPTTYHKSLLALILCILCHALIQTGLEDMNHYDEQSTSSVDLTHSSCCTRVYIFCVIFCCLRSSHSDDSHVHATGQRSACVLAQAHPTMSFICLVIFCLASGHHCLLDLNSIFLTRHEH